MKQRIRQVLAHFQELLQRFKKSEVEPSIVLLPLTPSYDSTKHGVYFDVIEEALAKDRHDIRNIALTGSYGVGKSSILSHVAASHPKEVISVSLSTLGFPEERFTSKGDPALAKDSSKTNQIQKEIVKQLLYSQDPLKTPGSRYWRTTRFRVGRTLGLAAILSVPVVIIFFLAGWTSSLTQIVPALTSVEWIRWLDDYGLGHLLVALVAMAILFGLLALFHNRFQISKFGAGAATIELSPKSATYFDEYLDEIVYFFEVVKCDIVIFEDIDRFEDAHIFETLRSLNSILNGARQLKGRPIRFIYAIKDSIFDELGARAAKEELDAEKPKPSVQRDAAEAELARANRTKFFDLVIPVVPFITHRSARDLLGRTMQDQLEHKVSNDLIDLAARHIADMRLIKNIRNEFAIFKRQVIDSGDIDLDQDKLFAMILYKSTHLSDFELIKLGQSTLDDLYRTSRSLIDQNLRRIDGALRELRLRRRGSTQAPTVARRLGNSLVQQLDLIGRVPNLTGRSLTIGGAAATDEELRTPEFWTKLAAADVTVSVTYLDPWTSTRTFELTKEQVENIVGEQINPRSWAADQRAKIEAEIAALQADRAILAKADMGQLLERNDIKLVEGDNSRSFREIAEGNLKSELALRLIEAGFIDRNFTLYTSTFYGERVSANAMNYVLKNVDPGTIDIHYQLEVDDVDAILREKGRIFLQEISAYNVSVVDYLLRRDPEGVKTIAKRLSLGGDDERALILAYLETGADRELFVSSLSSVWKEILPFLISEAGLDDELRTKLVDTGLKSISEEIDYVLDEDVRDYLVTSYSTLDGFTSEETTKTTAVKIAKLVNQAGARLPKLDDTAQPVRAELIALGAYVVSRENLLTALNGDETMLSLDLIAKANRDVYRRVLEDLDAYVTLLDEKTPTITDSAAFSAVIEDVISADDSVLSEIVALADAACSLSDITDVSTDYWPIFAEHGRFPLTFENVSAYVAEIGVDVHLAQMLTAASKIHPAAGAEESAKLELALQLLRAKDLIPDPELRATLAESIKLKKYIETSSIPTEQGELLGRLLVHDLIEDKAESFTALEATDTDGRAFAIGKSGSFVDYMTATEVTPSQVGLLINHSLVPSTVKDAIIDRFTEFTSGSTKANLSLVARYAVHQGKHLTWTETARLADEGVEPDLVLALVTPYLANLTMAHLAPVLAALGGEYAKLAVANGKHPRILNTAAVRALLTRLQTLSVVNSWSIAGDYLKVNLKKS